MQRVKTSREGCDAALTEERVSHVKASEPEKDGQIADGELHNVLLE